MAIIDYPITSNYGDIDSMHKLPHKGMDFGLPLYTPVEAIQDATVSYVGTNDILGNHVKLKLYNGDIIIYGHLAQFKVNLNDKVYKGDIIALSGGLPGMQGAGHSNGPHLHLTSIRDGVTVNPEPYLLGEQQNNSSPLIFPIMLILILIVCWKIKKWLFYGLGLFALIGIVFLVS